MAIHIASALHYLEANQIFHGDIKCARLSCGPASCIASSLTPAGSWQGMPNTCSACQPATSENSSHHSWISKQHRTCAEPCRPGVRRLRRVRARRSGNILLTEGQPHKRRAKLGDLGLARTLQSPLSTAGAVQGTFIYMVRCTRAPAACLFSPARDLQAAAARVRCAAGVRAPGRGICTVCQAEGVCMAPRQQPAQACGRQAGTQHKPPACRRRSSCS